MRSTCSIRRLSIDLTANFWFSAASVLLLTVVVALITEKIVEPRLGAVHRRERRAGREERMPPEESRGCKLCAATGCSAVLAVFALLDPAVAVRRCAIPRPARSSATRRS